MKPKKKKILYNDFRLNQSTVVANMTGRIFKTLFKSITLP